MKPLRHFSPYHVVMFMMIAAAATLPMLSSGAVSAQGNPTPAPTRVVTDNDVNRVSRNLYCPVCQNVPLEVCETEACARWRDQVRDLLAQGYTDDQVRQYFVEHFGTKTVGTPTDTLSQVLTIALPLALVGLIGVVSVLTLLRWRASRRQRARDDTTDRQLPTEPTEGSRPLSDEYRARLEEEIRGEE